MVAEGYSEARSSAVVAIARAGGRRLGVEGIALANLRDWVALLHDVGKLGVSDAMLAEPRPLSEAERVEVRLDAGIGERSIASTSELTLLATTIRAERERWDGAGYPAGLAGTEIPLISRVVLESDAFARDDLRAPGSPRAHAGRGARGARAHCRQPVLSHGRRAQRSRGSPSSAEGIRTPAAPPAPPPAAAGTRRARCRAPRARARCGVVHWTSSRRSPPAPRSRSTSATSATFDASVRTWNFDSAANRPPTSTP